jgi:hypothetical protein
MTDQTEIRLWVRDLIRAEPGLSYPRLVSAVEEKFGLKADGAIREAVKSVMFEVARRRTLRRNRVIGIFMTLLGGFTAVLIAAHLIYTFTEGEGAVFFIEIPGFLVGLVMIGIGLRLLIKGSSDMMEEGLGGVFDESTRPFR